MNLKGIYCLILECTANKKIQVGALGELTFSSGWYIYVGSALGSGGLARVHRHIRYYHEQYRRPKWHIDYILSDECMNLRDTVCAKTDRDLECTLANAIGGFGIKSFGCSDCLCQTHLFYRNENPLSEIYLAFEQIGLEYITHNVTKQ